MRQAYASKCKNEGWYPAMKKARLRVVAKSKQKAKREYSMLAAEKILSTPLCEKCGDRPPQENHHQRGRIGRLLCDTRFFRALCTPCHTWVHTYPNKAREIGLLAPANEWNVSP